MSEVPPKLELLDSKGKDVKSHSSATSPATSPIKDAFGLGKLSKPQSRVANDETLVKSDSTSQRDSLKLTKSHLSKATADSSKRNSTESPTTPKTDPFSPVDPLSQYIINRANATTNTSPVNSGNVAEAVLDRVTTESFAPDDGPAVKEKKKGVSLLGRLRGGKKKEVLEPTSEDPAEQQDDRLEGANAEPFYQEFDNLGFSPRYPSPPAYIKVRSQGKKEKEFNRLFLAQVLEDKRRVEGCNNASVMTESKIKRRKKDNGDATWALIFSKDGQYLATGGQDRLVRVWAVLSSREARRVHEKEEEANEGTQDSNMHLSAPVFRQKPIKVYEGHTSPVLDLSWSKNNFLLSSSMDKTVRLWHISRPECLCTFKHSDFVTSIQFHPRDDRFFLAGSLDAKVRLWSIPDKSVAFWNQMPEMITAVSFTPDGKTAIAGSLTGLVYFFDTEGLKYQTQIHNKSAYGKNAKGSKITGIQSMTVPPDDPSGEVKLLITSNDSRIRLYNLRDKSVEMKFKGNENSSSQIHARFSSDGRYIICGSEDKRVYVWSLSRGPSASLPEGKKDKRPVEVFEAHAAITTVAAMAPTKTRQLLSNSEDPIYDICNPPPVMLVSRAEVESIHSSKAPTDNGSIQPTPATAEGGGSFPRKPEESPAYVSRTAHSGGNIIVTADVSGSLKVFRQDCAFEKRRMSEFLAGGDSGSILSKTFGGNGAGIIRRASMMTHDSTRSSATRSRSRNDSNATQPSSERILSWRQSVAGPQDQKHTRSASPHKFSLRTMTGRSSNSASNSPAIGSTSTPSLNRVPSADHGPPRSNPGNKSGKISLRGMSVPIPTIIRQDSGSSSPKPLTPSPLTPSSSGLVTPADEQKNSPNKSKNGNSNGNGNGSSFGNATSHPLQLPAEIDRRDSTYYWRNDAWHEDVAAQLAPERDAHRAQYPADVRSRHTSLGVQLGKEITAVSKLSSETVSPNKSRSRSRSSSPPRLSDESSEGAFEDAVEG